MLYWYLLKKYTHLFQKEPAMWGPDPWSNALSGVWRTSIFLVTVSCQGAGSACVKGEVTVNSRSRGIFPLKPHSWSEEMEAQVGDVSCTGPIVRNTDAVAGTYGSQDHEAKWLKQGAKSEKWEAGVEFSSIDWHNRGFDLLIHVRNVLEMGIAFGLALDGITRIQFLYFCSISSLV